MIGAYYNENDPFAAAWLRELIKSGAIAPGEVDERSIVDVVPNELAGFAQCHFFAGIGVWSYALRRAGWPDDRPVWTGSCPCQPFSAAGKGGGFDDERHLWPAFFHLIGERRPAKVLGEQVASKDGLAWLDLVQADLEGAGYASGAVDLCAAGVGAPHIRQRLWWVAERRVADPQGETVRGKSRQLLAQKRCDRGQSSEGSIGSAVGGGGADGRLADAGEGERGRRATHGGGNEFDRAQSERDKDTSDIEWPGDVCGVDDTAGARHERSVEGPEGDTRHETRLRVPGAGCGQDRSVGAGPVNGLWRDADWLFCRDGKWRPVEPGTFPLAHGSAARVGRLRGYGNAINAEAAVAFIEACGVVI